ncbi:hypothetical protein [Ruegeria sp. EL01]|uniref:hypothetical protein n=1 Tax=Ruegeria sp. EL01 TaxID=2107578 RepID=UPI0013C4187B|nr:hypothetical protein [Ruegeria sp. EL01]
MKGYKMPKTTKRPIGTIYVNETKKTFGDKLKEGASAVCGITVFLWLLSIAFG